MTACTQLSQAPFYAPNPEGDLNAQTQMSAGKISDTARVGRTRKSDTFFSARLRQLIIEQSLTYGEFAQVVDIPLQRLQNMANGRTNRLTVSEERTITDLYNINPNWFKDEAAEQRLPETPASALFAKEKTFKARITSIVLADIESNGPIARAINNITGTRRR